MAVRVVLPQLLRVSALKLPCQHKMIEVSE